MIRILKSPWIALLPLTLAGLYALIYPTVRAKPSLETMGPASAVMIHRFRDLKRLDRDHLGALPDEEDADNARAPTWSAILGRENNVVGLPGVDPERPLFLIRLRPTVQGDESMVVLPTRDGDRLQGAFDDPSFIERGYTRRAKRLVRHGSWAAIAATYDDAARVGTTPLRLEDRGEDHGIVLDVEGVATLALNDVTQAPWRDLLGALGVSVELRKASKEASSLTARRVLTGTERLARVIQAWDELRFWSFNDSHRVVLEATPLPGAVAKALREVHAKGTSTVDAPPLPATRDLRAWFRVPNAAASGVVSTLLPTLGIRLPDALEPSAASDDEATTSTIPDLTAIFPVKHGWWIGAGRAEGHPYATTWGAVGTDLAKLPLEPFFGEVLPSPGAPVTGEEGAWPLTLLDSAPGRQAPAGTLAVAEAAPWSMIAFGASAEAWLSGMASSLAAASSTPIDGPMLQEGWVELARAHLSARFAQSVLGPAVERGGVFRALEGGDIHVLISTNGAVLRLELVREN